MTEDEQRAVEQRLRDLSGQVRNLTGRIEHAKTAMLDLVQERLYVGDEKIATFWYHKDDDVVEVAVNRRVPKGGCLTLKVEYVFRDSMEVANMDT